MPPECRLAHTGRIDRQNCTVVLLGLNDAPAFIRQPILAGSSGQLYLDIDDLDGALREIPCAWDFPDFDTATARLPEARVGTWGGFVFVNLDVHAQPLAEPTAPPLRGTTAWARGA